MKGFYLANACSINLNFLVYIHNLYLNSNNHGGIPDKFPWLPVEQNSLLNFPELEARAGQLWSFVFDSISDSGDLIKQDLEYWVNNKFDFSSLFNSNAIGAKTHEDTRKSFMSWYWGIGNHLCSIFSDRLVEKYYQELLSMAETKNIQLKDIYFYLQVIYDTPRTEWKTQNGRMVVISPNAHLPAIADVFTNCAIF